MKGFLKSLLATIIILCVQAPLHAQQADPEITFYNARKLAAKKEYAQAIDSLKTLTQTYPQNSDYTLYLSRVYFWMGNNADARIELLKLWNEEKPLKEALNLLIQIEAKEGNLTAVSRLCQKGKQNFPDDVFSYNLQQAIAFQHGGQDSAALHELNNIKHNNIYYHAASYLKTQILQKQKNTVTAGYFYTRINGTEPATQQSAFIEYGRKANKLTAIGRINYANRFNTNDVQLEGDAYYTVGKRTYTYFNGGVGIGNNIFPAYKFGTEIFRDINNVSTSIGARYLHFSSNNNALLFTGHLAYNAKGLIIGYRPFAVQANNNFMCSHLAFIKKWMADNESFVQLDVQKGTLPYYVITTDLFLRTNTYRAGINTKWRIKDNFFVQPIVMYEREEFLLKQYRDRANFQLILSRRF